MSAGRGALWLVGWWVRARGRPYLPAVRGAHAEVDALGQRHTPTCHARIDRLLAGEEEQGIDSP